jgi:DNA polymerase elongation subunit (family B)
MKHLIIDVASAPIPNAADYLDGTVKAPTNYGAEAAAKYIAEKTADKIEMAATDIDLARLTGLALADCDGWRDIVLLKTEPDEHKGLTRLAGILNRYRPEIITYNGFSFDLPLLMRRAKYLGVEFPRLNLDRYRSNNRDLCEELCDRNPQRRRSLSFYCKRLGWTDLVKPLHGSEEAKVHDTGKWDELHASLTHDIEATYRLALWMGVVEQPQPQPEEEPTF